MLTSEKSRCSTVDLRTSSTVCTIPPSCCVNHDFFGSATKGRNRKEGYNQNDRNIAEKERETGLRNNDREVADTAKHSDKERGRPRPTVRQKQILTDKGENEKRLSQLETRGRFL